MADHHPLSPEVKVRAEKYDSIVDMGESGSLDGSSHGSDTRRRQLSPGGARGDEEKEADGLETFETSCVLIGNPENAIEAHRISNNYLFGFKKWKSHVTSRPLEIRSEVVQDLYADLSKLKPVKVSTIRPTNIAYVILFGWWIALLYLLVAVLMCLTFIGRHYAMYCVRMANYYMWPFGKFVYHIHPPSSRLNGEVAMHQEGSSSSSYSDERTGLLFDMEKEVETKRSFKCDREFWRKPATYVWLLLGVPLLLIVHGVVAFITFFFVISIPIAKVNLKAILHILWFPPDQVAIGDSSSMTMDPVHLHSEIVMYTHQSVNVFYYKYTIDGMNVILVNLLVFVVLSLVMGYADPDNKLTNGVTKCILGVLAIVPLTYYIGMAIISISAQSSFAIGAVMNATFGSVVELILYVVAMIKGASLDSSCYNELVRSGLTGTIVGSILFIPGICMIVGGLKYRSQSFNPKSASVTALLMFVAIGGVFAPTLFSKIFGDLQCNKCEANGTSTNYSLQCTDCHQALIGLEHDDTLYKQHIEPLVYACAIILPIAYLIGVFFSLKTHTSYLYDEFNEQQSHDNQGKGGHGAPQWSRIKSVLILLLSAVLIALCADLITDNIQDLMESSGISEYFIGVTMIAMIPELPEIVNGIQFALQNNVNLGIEIGTNTAIQVCLIQVPFLVLIDLIHPFNFLLIFNDIHLWAVIFSVIVINYIFQDGKSDYFQGTALVAIYLILMCMYFFARTPPGAKC